MASKGAKQDDADAVDFSSAKVGLKLKDMCAYMGVAEDETHLFWVAELALLAKLPPHWKQVAVPPSTTRCTTAALLRCRRASDACADACFGCSTRTRKGMHTSTITPPMSPAGPTRAMVTSSSLWRER